MSTELFPELDRNKTPLTHDVTAAVVNYLDEQGFKPVETEVPVCEGWVADVAGVSAPTRTEAVRMKLIPRPPAFDYNRWRDEEYKTRNQRQREAHDSAYALLPNPLTALVEVKTSRADFIKDRKWLLDSPTNLRYLAVPVGMLKPPEYPAGWSVLSVSDSGVVRSAQRGVLSFVPVEQQIQTVLAVAIRRDHQTRYARLREFQKTERARQTERTSMWRFTYCVRAVQRILKADGESVERVLENYSIKGLTAELIEDLRALWGKGVAP